MDDGTVGNRGPEGPDDALGYELEAHAREVPALPGTVAVLEDADEAIDRAAADMLIHAQDCLRRCADVHLALAGEPSLEPFYVRLMVDPAWRGFPWRRTHVWMTHERAVAFDDERSCCRLVREIIGDHADLPREQFHPIFPHADDPARAYEAAMRETMSWRERGEDRLDWVMLGFDEHGALAGWHAQDRPAPRPGGPFLRPTTGGFALDLAVINAARVVAILCLGDAARDALRPILAGEAPDHPIHRIRPVAGDLRWYMC